jgi:hypothetical protein
MSPDPYPDLHCLNALCDDYENLDAITSEVRKATHGAISKGEVAECLRHLVNNGLVTAFEFDGQHSKYIPVTTLENELSENWFLISEKGGTELDQNWVDD